MEPCCWSLPLGTFPLVIATWRAKWHDFLNHVAAYGSGKVVSMTIPQTEVPWEPNRLQVDMSSACIEPADPPNTSRVHPDDLLFLHQPEDAFSLHIAQQAKKCHSSRFRRASSWHPGCLAPLQPWLSSTVHVQSPAIIR
eukprot:2197644-Amphidinium_carterae.1